MTAFAKNPVVSPWRVLVNHKMRASNSQPSLNFTVKLGQFKVPVNRPVQFQSSNKKAHLKEMSSCFNWTPDKIKNARWGPLAGCCWSSSSHNHARSRNREPTRALRQEESLAVSSKVSQDRRKIWNNWRRYWDRSRILQHRKTVRSLRLDKDPVSVVAVSADVVQGSSTKDGIKRPAWTSRTILMSSASPPISWWTTEFCIQGLFLVSAYIYDVNQWLINRKIYK